MSEHGGEQTGRVAHGHGHHVRRQPEVSVQDGDEPTHGVPLGRGLVQLVAAREEHPRRTDGQPDGQPDLVLGHALHHEADQDRDPRDEEDRLVERGHGRPIQQDAPDSDSCRHEDEPADPDAPADQPHPGETRRHPGDHDREEAEEEEGQRAVEVVGLVVAGLQRDVAVVPASRGSRHRDLEAARIASPAAR